MGAAGQEVAVETEGETAGEELAELGNGWLVMSL